MEKEVKQKSVEDNVIDKPVLKPNKYVPKSENVPVFRENRDNLAPPSEELSNITTIMTQIKTQITQVSAMMKSLGYPIVDLLQ